MHRGAPAVGHKIGTDEWLPCGSCGGTGLAGIRDPEGFGETPAEKRLHRAQCARYPGWSSYPPMTEGDIARALGEREHET